MGLKEFYYKLEDKYFEMLDNLEEKGINLYKIVDPLEKNGIPTFPIFILIILAIIGLLIFLLLPVFGITGQPSGTAVRFVDESANPLSQTTLNITLNDQAQTITTDRDGFVYFKDLDDSQLYTLKLVDDTYVLSENRESIEINPVSQNNYQVYLEKGSLTITKTILFKTAAGDLITSSLNVEFYCSANDYSKDAIVTNGEFTLTGIPRDCGTLQANIDGRTDYDPIIPLEGTTGEITFSSNYNYATLQVVVKDKDLSSILPNMSVSVYDSLGQLADTGQTNTNGIFTSELVQVGKQYKLIVSDPNGIYSGITDLDYVNGLQTPVQISTGINNIELKVKKDVIGFIQIKVKDKTTGVYLDGVTAKLSKGASLIETKTTDSTGFVKFGVKENVSYTLTLDKAGYLLSNQQASISSSIQEIQLRSMDATSTSVINISVTDSEMIPIEYATVKIWDALNNTIVKILTTDVSGRLIIPNLDPNVTYFAEAITGKYSGKTNNFVVKERESTDVPIIVAIGQGTYNLTILDTDGTPLSGATVKVYDASRNVEMTEKQTTTNETGLAIIPVRADKLVYFLIEKDDTRIISKQYSIEADSMVKDTIYIPSNISSSANIEFVGYYASNGDLLTSLGAGQSATARFVLNVDKRYSKVIAHIRTGEGDVCGTRTYSVTEDSIYIKQVKFAGNKAIGSINYTPCLGETKDTASVVRKDAKWFNVTLENPIEGSYIIDADIVVTDTATTNQAIFYRAEYQQGSSVLRSPQDNVLGTSVTSTSKQALYAYAKQLAIYVGDSTGCENGVCYTFSFTDKTTGVEKKVMDKFTAKDGTDYKFKFRFNLERPATDATMVISTTGQTIRLNNYTITPGGNFPINGNEFSNISLGSISANGSVNGEVDLSVINDASDNITITILAGGETIISKQILFSLTPSKKLNVEVIPKTIIPYVTNSMNVEVTDDTNQSLADASVFVKVNGKTITDGKTNRDGILAFVLPATNTNDNLEITVRKQGYRTNTTNLIITENLITSIPEKLDVQLDISQGYSNTSNVVLLNNTILPLTITGIKSNIDSDYVKITSNSQNTTLDPGSQVGLVLTTALTENGIELMTQKVLKGSILVSVNEPTLAKTWVIEIPITVRITFGNAVDSTDCLEINPADTTIRVESTNDVEYEVKLNNACTVGDVPADLGKIYVDADYKSTKKLGDFYVVVSGQEKKLEPDTKIEVLNRLVAEKSTAIKLIFKVNKSKSGISTPIITFSSNRPNVNGIDVIESTHNPKVILNNYSSCIETPSGSIVVPYCTSYGYGVLGGNAMAYNPLVLGTNPYAYSGMTAQAYSQTPINNNYPNTFNSYFSSYPFNNLSERPPAGYQGLNTGNNSYGQTGCQTAQLQIKNSCYEDLALQFNAIGGVTLVNNDSENGSDMILKKGESKTLGVQGAQVLGQYKIAMSAKPDDDTIEEYTYVKDITVTVNRPVDILPSDCITVVPTEFDFSKIDTTQQKLMVVNSCYDAGYALLSLSVLNPEVLQVGGIQYFSIGDVNAVLKPRKTYRIIDGKTNEIMSIDVRRNPEITEKAFKTDTKESAAKIVSNLRTDFYDLATTINLKATLGIIYSTPRLSADEYDQDIILKDSLQWLSYLNDLSCENGTAGTLTGQTTCIPTETTTPTPSTGTGTGPSTGTTFPEYFAGSPVLGAGECYNPTGMSKLGLTGKDNYEKYGFNRLLFTYNENEITDNVCDYGNVYCDQDQLRIAISKKAVLLKTTNNYIHLDGINFRKENNKVAANPYLLDTNPLDKTFVESNLSITTTQTSTDAYLNTLTTKLNTIPIELRQFTIIEITINPNETLSDANITALVNKASNGGNKWAIEDTPTTNKYQFTVHSFLGGETELEKEADKKVLSEFLYQFLNTMDIYYGDTLSPFIINAKTYGNLETGLTKSIFTESQFASNAWKIDLNSTSKAKSIDTPGTYLVSIILTTNNNELTYTAERLINSPLDYYNTASNASYKSNMFFTNPTNALYYNYSGVPFRSTNAITGKARATNVLSSYEKWSTIQDGYILTIPATHNSITFKDTRPIQMVPSGEYHLEYLYNGKYVALPNATQRNTSFAFVNMKHTIAGSNYQMFVYGKNEIRFNISAQTMNPTSTYSNIYGIPYNLSTVSKFNEAETSSVTNMVNGIVAENMCFNVNNSSFTLWYNPANAK